MDFLQQEILRKKREVEELVEKKRKDGPDGEPIAQPKKKYVKRGEIEKEREKQYLVEAEKVQKEKEAKLLALMKKPESGPQAPEENPLLKLPIEEIFRRLRKRGQPITLFGETDIDRAERLRKLEEREPLETAEGTADDFGKALRELDKESSEPKKEKEKKKKEEKKKEKEEEEDKGSNLTTKEEFILYVLKKVLKAWRQELDERSEVQKRSSQGKIDTATYKQAKKHIKPAIKLLRARQLPHDLLGSIYDIAQFLEKREYVKAHDCYLRMAIGNAPWPMGVTMVGIHERSAREKIHSNQIAHVLNDETQRKYIQAIKRMMTFCQRKWPADNLIKNMG